MLFILNSGLFEMLLSVVLVPKSCEIFLSLVKNRLLLEENLFILQTHLHNSQRSLS